MSKLQYVEISCSTTMWWTLDLLTSLNGTLGRYPFFIHCLMPVLEQHRGPSLVRSRFMVLWHRLRPHFYSSWCPANNGHAGGHRCNRFLNHQKKTHGAQYFGPKTKSIDAFCMSVSSHVYDLFNHLLSGRPYLRCRESASARPKMEQRCQGMFVASRSSRED